MKLAAEVIPYALPFREPYVTARGRLEQREMVLLRLRDEEGRIGLGEAVPLSLRRGVTLERVVRELRALVDEGALEALAGAGQQGQAARLPEEVQISAPARCAVMTALLDLGEKRSSSPQPATVPVPCNATLVAGEPAAVAKDALRWAAEGFTTFKLKLGVGDDVGQVRAVRDALGEEAQIRVDANAAWNLETAKRALRALEPLGVQLAEQPVATMEEAAELAGMTSIPLAGDESVATAEDAERAARSGAFQLTGVKLSKVGGMEAGFRIAQALPAYVSSALDGPVGIAAGARLAARIAHGPWPASGERAHGLATQRLFASTIAAVECELRDGAIRAPVGPGLGVEIDEKALQAHRL